MSQPVLRTERLVIVPLADSHLDLEVELDADAEVLRYLYGRSRSRDEVEESHRKRMEFGRVVDGLGYWMAFDGDDFAGLVALQPEGGPGSAELGYRIPRKQWRRGFASEVSRELLRHAFETVGLKRVFAQTMVVNEGSQAVMRAVGMRYVRNFHEEWEHPLPGAEQGEIEYEFTADQWAAAGRR
ncbi:RimJ/RimL family protein N-acetyltransferase [Actinoplanes lutulentus]|uniref:RimJ/RimL family protein N-acetyltransferase n=1 Tax=Actinoplanes lutulentus TaxID=1287878 RepID=A0A327Z9Q5_9ACTN|nr:GNAT family N-acetyltransferase [Actinoplanes lutulentus]MBB2948477.1 RimJ/RimL family protein N-acetyltransferase [Actinoplanes lutulentus]RAK34491.1 RimJ/RimL family protein N-acetyltransferase [Actinoplanes lutulentus]